VGRKDASGPKEGAFILHGQEDFLTPLIYITFLIEEFISTVL
jgi:hypothetical protein